MQDYFLNVALSGIILSGGECMDSFCSWALLYFHLDVNKMSLLRVSVKKQELITKEEGNEKQDSQKGKNKGINILCVLKAFWLKE